MLKDLDSKLIERTRLLILSLGVLVSWKETITAFQRFYQFEGTIFKIKDCVLPNPVTTPCFWGALAFAGALFWAYKLYKKQNLKSERYLMYFLIGSVIFAWTNFAIELKGVEPVKGALIAPCPATAPNPFLSACFFGSILFTLALISTYVISKSPAREQK